jgi:hypothetical protein
VLSDIAPSRLDRSRLVTHWSLAVYTADRSIGRVFQADYHLTKSQEGVMSSDSENEDGFILITNVRTGTQKTRT